MANKIDLEEIKKCAQSCVSVPSEITKLMQLLEKQLKAEDEEKAEKPPTVKKQFGIYIYDDSGKLKDMELTATIVQIPEDDPLPDIPNRIHAGAHEFNTTPKGIRMPIETIGEACEVVPAKFFKEHNIWIKTKAPIWVISGSNKIPTA
jgi:hypothetical protein